MGKLLKLITLLSALLIAATATAARPNIVFIMVDDLDVAVWDEALRLGLLPNIQSELIDKGTSFKEMFTSQSLCCPSRATLFTGMYPHNHGVVGNPTYIPDLYKTFQKDMEPVMIARWLKQPYKINDTKYSTYRTGFIGKYLNDSGKNPYHIPKGTDPETGAPMVIWDVWQALVPRSTNDSVTALKTPVQCMYNYAISNVVKRDGGLHPFVAGRKDSTKGVYQTSKLALLAVEFIESSPSDNPFFLVVTPTAPHAEAGIWRDELHTKKTGCPDSNEHRVRTLKQYEYGDNLLVAKLPAKAKPSYNEEIMTDKPVWMRDLDPPPYKQLLTLFNDKIAAMRPIDDLVRDVLEALRLKDGGDGKVLDNTLIIFTSDNGYQYGTHRLRGKEDVYEESIRIPMVVRAPNPNRNPVRPQVQQAWVMNNDWAPTIANFAEVAPTVTVDGREFRSLLASEAATNGQHTMMIRNGFNPGDGIFDSDKHQPFLAVRTRDTTLTDGSTHVYVETYKPDYSGPRPGEYYTDRELYDFSIDPYQNGSVHETRTDQIVGLKTRLDALKTCSGDTCRQLEGELSAARKPK